MIQAVRRLGTKEKMTKMIEAIYERTKFFY